MSNAFVYVSVFSIASIVLAIAIGTVIDRMGDGND